MTTDDVRMILMYLKRLLRTPIPSEELAVAHIACPNLYNVYMNLAERISELETEVCYREDREYDRMMDAQTAKEEYYGRDSGTY